MVSRNFVYMWVIKMDSEEMDFGRGHVRSLKEEEKVKKYKYCLYIKLLKE